MKLHILILLVFAMISCSSEKTIEVKDEQGKVIERYIVNKEGVKNGVYETFYAGKLKSKEYYENGVQTGKRIIYFDNGNPEIEENYSNGQLNGPYKVFYESGELQLEMTYVNNLIEGKSQKYYKSGQKMEDVTFENNEENGPFVEFWENGNLKWEGAYLNGDNEFGELKKYNEDGVLTRKLMCDSLAVCRTFWTLEPNSDKDD